VPRLLCFSLHTIFSAPDGDGYKLAAIPDTLGAQELGHLAGPLMMFSREFGRGQFGLHVAYTTLDDNRVQWFIAASPVAGAVVFGEPKGDHALQ